MLRRLYFRAARCPQRAYPREPLARRAREGTRPVVHMRRVLRSQLLRRRRPQACVLELRPTDGASCDADVADRTLVLDRDTAIAAHHVGRTDDFGMTVDDRSCATPNTSGGLGSAQHLGRALAGRPARRRHTEVDPGAAWRCRRLRRPLRSVVGRIGQWPTLPTQRRQSIRSATGLLELGTAVAHLRCGGIELLLEAGQHRLEVQLPR